MFYTLSFLPGAFSLKYNDCRSKELHLLECELRWSDRQWTRTRTGGGVSHSVLLTPSCAKLLQLYTNIIGGGDHEVILEKTQSQGPPRKDPRNAVCQEKNANSVWHKNLWSGEANGGKTIRFNRSVYPLIHRWIIVTNSRNVIKAFQETVFKNLR